jgi:hypothetical protein
MAESTLPEVTGPEIADAAASRVGRYRWVICGLLFAATAINYVDRQMIGVLKPTISADLGWSETDFADGRLLVPARLCDRLSELRLGSSTGSVRASAIRSPS